MKKSVIFVLTLVLAICLPLQLKADNDRVITFDRLPATAQAMLKQNFADKTPLAITADRDDYKVMYFYDLDSTKHISDSAFLQMRQKATTNKRYKDGLQFADGQKTKKLNFIRVKMLIQKDTVYQTFYFDDQITQVLAFKED